MTDFLFLIFISKAFSEISVQNIECCKEYEYLEPSVSQFSLELKYFSTFECCNPLHCVDEYQAIYTPTLYIDVANILNVWYHRSEDQPTWCVGKHHGPFQCMCPAVKLRPLLFVTYIQNSWLGVLFHDLKIHVSHS